MTGTNDGKATIIITGDAPQTKKLAQEYNINCIDVDYDHSEKVLSFNGTATVYSCVEYDYITDCIYEYPDTEYLYFDKLIFDGVPKGDINFDGFEFVDNSSENLALNHLYVNIKKVTGDNTKNITFAQMLEELENGNFDAFRLVIISDETTTEQTIFGKIAEYFNRMFEDALNAMSKAINFFANLFKKKK